MPPLICSFDARYGCSLPGIKLDKTSNNNSSNILNSMKPFVPLCNDHIASFSEIGSSLDIKLLSAKFAHTQPNSPKSSLSLLNVGPQLPTASNRQAPRLCRPRFIQPAPSELAPSNLPSSPTSVLPTIESITEERLIQAAVVSEELRVSSSGQYQLIDE